MEAVVAVTPYYPRGHRRGQRRGRSRGYGRGRSGRGSVRKYRWRSGRREARAVEAGPSSREAPLPTPAVETPAEATPEEEASTAAVEVGTAEIEPME
ncbi:uncharacterized protein LOC123320553 isoform X2 [Coccinella septempunctata]|uniref:uncharacterized protein LOC123320553 isoform X2 n=1 Tax=Coccinella septempunctata TaxID=41139 RepID=UPI001D089E0B|nr:uncharacterized protein LOC123320553 isoform X2 [Coccinella septempunctata]